MTVLVVSGSSLVNQLAVLVDGHKAASFSQLLSYLTMVSVGVWSMVLVSTLFRILARRKYKYRLQSQRR
jgi:hypothetical protein